MHSWGTFPILYVCQHSAVLPYISLISLSIGSYLELAIFREDFSSVARVNVRFSWVFYFVFICSGYELNSPHYIMGGMPRPVFIISGLSRLSEVTIFVTDACMLNLVREGEEDCIEAIRYRRRLKIFENFLLAISLNSQNIYLCHRKPTNNSLFLLTFAVSVCWNCEQVSLAADGKDRNELQLLIKNFSSCFHASSKTWYEWPWFVHSAH